MRNPLLKTLAIILLISVFLPLGNVHAREFLNGTELVQLMREYEKAERNAKSANLYEAGEYLGYVMGFYDATWFFYAEVRNITPKGVADVVAKFLNQHPEKWNRPAWDLVMEALKEAFPRQQ